MQDDKKTVFIPFKGSANGFSKGYTLQKQVKTAENAQSQSESNPKEKYIIKGYASIFDVVDSHNDRVVRGAFTKSLQSSKKPKFLWQHNDKEVIGVWRILKEDDRGLYVEGELIESVQKAFEAKALIENQAIDGLSIGYRIRKAIKGQDASSIRLLTEVDLLEISLVTFPSNQEATLSS